ncbi:MAG: transglutaminase-like domain-containing protein [Desulfobacteraceae bacterium]|jgi:transglutaminase-like putative cysteine protease
MNQIDQKYLSATAIIDSDHQEIIQFAADTTKDCHNDPVEKAVKIYYAVRDGIWYDPYYPFYLPEHYRASNILRSGRGFCVCKASLLCALGRVCGIPSRVGFADVRNHLATKQLIDMMGSDLFVYHGFTEFYLEGKWVVATPAFNIELCHRHKVVPLEFNGREDSIFQPYNLEKKQFMDYVAYHGSYADIPVNEIVAAWEDAYGKDRVRAWIDAFEKSGPKSGKDFYSEDLIGE